MPACAADKIKSSRLMPYLFFLNITIMTPKIVPIVDITPYIGILKPKKSIKGKIVLTS